jgi:hypothetical protein
MCKGVNGLADMFVYLEKAGEVINEDEWHLADARVDLNETEDEDYEAMLNDTLNISLSIADSRRKDSVQDSKFIKVRYRYAKGSRKHGKRGQSSRDFCRLMHRTNKVYRKEDILQMQKDGVNSQLGHNKQPYSIWRHKGGVNCYDTWERVIYIKKTKKDGEPYGGDALRGTYKSTVGQAKKKGFDPKRNKYKNDRRVAEAQIDRADKGHHPSYRKNK